MKELEEKIDTYLRKSNKSEVELKITEALLKRLEDEANNKEKRLTDLIGVKIYFYCHFNY